MNEKEMAQQIKASLKALGPPAWVIEEKNIQFQSDRSTRLLDAIKSIERVLFYSQDFQSGCVQAMKICRDAIEYKD